MSIKDLFNNKGVPKIQKSVSTEEIVDQVESSDFIDSKRKQFDQFVPPIDFTSASNFAKFGSAELYYEKAFERIHKYYPYDGTLHEKIEFENSSSYLDKYVLSKLYPRTNGYLNFISSSNHPYISIFGGPHTASGGMVGKTLDSTFDLSMKYDEEKKKTSAFEFRGTDGVTIEFWLKVPQAGGAGQKPILHVSGAEGAGAIKLSQQNANIVFNMVSGSGTPVVLSETFTNILTDLNWNHYAFTALSSSSGIMTKAFKNGQLFGQVEVAKNIPHILPTTSGLNARIGKTFDTSITSTLTGSMDEFRFWKTARTPEDIFNTWFVPVGGGTNKHDSNVSLGCYLKFNEGITGNNSIDRVALDYSGRINNGTIENYVAALRETGSAITEKLTEPEFKDPIIYSSHPDVISKKAQYKTSGSLADYQNGSMFYNYFPSWMQEDDEQNGKQLKYLSQVIGSYFDTLWHQISFLDNIQDQYYISGSNKALPFAKKLLYDQGFVLPDLFVDATKLENFRQKDDNEVYEKEINEVRNIIYHNIHNNLNTIYKSKGTEKSFRNFFRSAGIGQDVVKLKVYADDSTNVLRNNYEYKSFGRKYLNFNVDGHFDASIHQTSSTNNPNKYIPRDSNYTGSFTLQSEIILPKKQRQNELNYNAYPYLTSSLFGYHTGVTYAHPSLPDGLQAFVVHSASEGTLDPDDKQRVKFVLTGSNLELTSDWYSQQYENNKWSLAVRMKHESYPTPNITGTTKDDYLIEFYGVEADGNTERNRFLLSTSSVAHSYYSSNKIFYAGAHKTNFTGSTLHYSDVKLGYLRYWHSYLSNDAIRQHAFDSETFGANEPFEQDLINVYPVEIPREKTLAFHWAFHDLTASNSSGEFLVSDLSSGSLGSNYGPLSGTIGRYVPAVGINFNNSSTSIVDRNYIFSARKRLPDDVYSSDQIVIKTDETEQFFVDEDVSDNFYSFEKSMWGTISDEMMNIFSTALDLNNLIGQPNQKYHHKYALADFLRDRFFDDVENEPDIERFTSFYKWIDDSISIALQQLVPASARFSEKINNVIESHTLERNKYVHQIPKVTTYNPGRVGPEGSIRGITEMKYNWRFGHASPSASLRGDESRQRIWHQERSRKSGLRETLRLSRNNHTIQSSGLIRKEIDGSARIGDIYASRKFANLYNVGMKLKQTIHGGTNFDEKKNLRLFHESLAPAGRIESVPQNIITVGVGAEFGIVKEQLNNDDPPSKNKYNVNALVGNRSDQEYGYKLLGNFLLPLNVMSGTINSGYNAIVETSYSSGVYLANIHNDIVGTINDIPIQGPFTEKHVGGLEYRHIDINSGTDTQGTRPEGWSILLGDHVASGDDGAFGFVGPDYETPYPSSTKPKANRYRDEVAKRPLNVKNIKTTTLAKTAGNYRNEIELFSVSPTFQKTWAIEAYSDPSVDILPPFISNSLPSSTHYQSLIGVAPFPSGNVFGVSNNNRQPDTGSLQTGTRIVDYSYSVGSFTVQGNNGVNRSGHKLSLTRDSVTKVFQVGASTGGNTIGLTYSDRLENSNWTELINGINSTYTNITASFASIVSLGDYYSGIELSTTSTASNLSRLTASFSSGFGTGSTEQFAMACQVYWSDAAAASDKNYLLNIGGDREVYFQNNKLYCDFSYVDNRGDIYIDRRFIDVSSYEDTSTHLIVQTIGTAKTINTSNAIKFYINGSQVSTGDVTEALGDLVVNNSGLGGTAQDPVAYRTAGNSIELFQNLARRGTFWVDEFVLYDAAISGVTLSNLVNTPIPTVGTTRLVTHLRLAGTAFSDQSTTSNNFANTYANGTIFENNPAAASTDYGLVSLSGFSAKKLYNPGNRAGWLKTSASANINLTFANTATSLPLSYGTTTAALFSSLVAPTITTNTAPILVGSNDNVITIPRTDLTGSERNIVTRFSAPGGPEIQSIGYLDAYTQTFSVHNALPFRNLSVLGSGSGEAGTIRVEDHLGFRRGLRALRTLHNGKFGTDGTHGIITTDGYPFRGSFNKQHGNELNLYTWNASVDITASLSESDLITDSNYDNMHINRPIPRSELQYSWIHNATSGSAGTTHGAPVQRIFGYAPRNGVVSSSAGYVAAIVFPTASSIFGSP
tara:strand:- start:2325 stop:8615 length:6291 start_codon:yes stop_codon:yes gene_type:complete